MKNLKLGDQGIEVTDLQTKLHLLGFAIDIDGDFGGQTLSAVNSFLKIYSLPQSDIVNDAVYNSITSEVSSLTLLDKVSMDRVLKLHPKIRFEVVFLLKACYKANVRIRIVQGLRTFAEQDELYAQGRTKPGKIVSNARGGYSNHNYGFAIDFCLLHANGTISWDQYEDADKDGQKDWIEVVNIFKSHQFEAGLYWKFVDPPHLEKNFNYTVKQLLALHMAKKVDKDGYVLI